MLILALSLYKALLVIIHL